MIILYLERFHYSVAVETFGLIKDGQ